MATILGLLLVVTFIANYLATTLPNTMGQNDLQHEMAVENQVAQLSARAEAVAGVNAVGAQVSQPISLGSLGAPPFARPDSATLTALSAITNTSGNYPQSGINLTLSGPTLYAPPLGFGANRGSPPSGCTTTSTSLNCPAINGAIPIKWNLSGGDGKTYTVTLGTGSNLVLLNFSTNASTLSVSGISGMPIYVQVIGNNDTLTLSGGGGNNAMSVNITGSYDSITAGSFPGGTRTVYIHVVGDHDTIPGDVALGGNTMFVSFVGTADTFAVVPGGGSKYFTYFTGFDALNPTSSSCPYGALALTDAVTGYTVTNGQSANAKLTQSFNNSTAYPTWGNLTPSSRWSIHYHPVLPFACPYMTTVTVPFTPSGLSGFVVRLQNTYAPSAEVAYDQGAVVYAQPGSLPLFIVPPSISLVSGELQVFVPWFSNTLSGESGLGTAEVSLRLLSTTSLDLPPSGFSFASGSSITISVVSPYAAAWYAYFLAQSALSPYVTCSGSHNVCTALYNPQGLLSLGTVKLTIPAAGLAVDLTTAMFAVSVS